MPNRSVKACENSHSEFPAGAVQFGGVGVLPPILPPGYVLQHADVVAEVAHRGLVATVTSTSVPPLSSQSMLEPQTPAYRPLACSESKTAWTAMFSLVWLPAAINVVENKPTLALTLWGFFGHCRRGTDKRQGLPVQRG